MTNEEGKALWDSQKPVRDALNLPHVEWEELTDKQRAVILKGPKPRFMGNLL